MKRFVIDASVVMKWLVTEPGTPDALALRGRAELLAPDLLSAECANILWKKVRRGELAAPAALAAAGLLERAQIELRPMRSLMHHATQLAIALDHPAYDCIYLALARHEACPFVTADDTLIRKIGQAGGVGCPEALNLHEGAARAQI